VSPVIGAPEGVHLRAGDSGQARAQVRLAGGPLPAGTYDLVARITAQQGAGQAGLAGGSVDVAAGSPAELHARIVHGGGTLRFDATLAGSAGAEIWIDQLHIDPAPVP